MSIKDIVRKIIAKKIKSDYFTSKWLSPDNKVYSAGKAGHQDWIDTHEDFLVEKGYLKQEEIEDSSIEYMIGKHDWIRLLDGTFHFKEKNPKTLKRIEKYLFKYPMKSFELWDVKDNNYGTHTFEDLVREKSLAKLIKNNKPVIF